MIVDAITSSITTITDTTGTAQTRSTSPFTLPNNCFIVLPDVHYANGHASGDAVYTINGGSEVSFGAPLFNQGSTNDKVCFFVARVVTGGTCIISMKNCSYDMCPPIVLTGDAHYKVTFTTAVDQPSISENPPASGNFPVSSNALAPVWNTEIPANVTAISSSKVAIAAMTHGPDTGVPVINASGSWTVRAQADDYDGLFQPGLIMYKQLSDNTAGTADITFNQSIRYTITQIIIEDAPEIYLVMGAGSENPTEIEGWFGHDGKGGPDDQANIVFDPPVPANYGVIPGLSVFGHDLTLGQCSDSGGNTWAIKQQVAYNSESGDGNGASLTALHSILTSPMSNFNYNATALAPGANGRYGQLWAYVFKNPHPTDFVGVAAVFDTLQVAQNITPGSGNPNRNKTFWMFKGNNRGHTENLKPYTKPSGYTIPKLVHPMIDADGAESAVHDSITQSGWTFGKLVSGFTAENPTFRFDGASTFEARCMLIGVNLSDSALPAGAPDFQLVNSIWIPTRRTMIGY